MTCEEALPVLCKILLKSQDEMKDKKQELELSVLSEKTDFVHKILDREVADQMTAQALQEIEQEAEEMNWSLKFVF